MIPGNFHERIDSIFGWLFPVEAELLFRYARDCETNIVEIGSFEGKSTACLAMGSLNGNHSLVYSIDPHRGSPDIFNFLAVSELDTFEKFKSNMAQFDLLDIIRSIRKTSEEAAVEFNEPIGLLFIDGRHDYDFVKLDGEKWIPKVIDNGIIIFHDSIEWEGPRLVVQELIQSGIVEKIETIGTATIFKKRPIKKCQERTVKLLLGGVMLGDTFHAIPLLNQLVDQGFEKIIWMCGSYMQPVVQFLSNFYPIEFIVREDLSSPDSLQTRKNFKGHYLSEFNSIVADDEVFGEGGTFDCIAYSSCSPDINLRNIHRLENSVEDSIVVHPYTLHTWKNTDAISRVDWKSFGLTIYTIGAINEPHIPHSIDLRGRPFLEVAQKVLSSKLGVVIHSAIACLSMYLNHSSIVIHPWADAQSKSPFLSFNNFRSNMLDIINPSNENLIEAVKQKLTN
jgi:MMP 1-O-methyltransferase